MQSVGGHFHRNRAGGHSFPARRFASLCCPGHLPPAGILMSWLLWGLLALAAFLGDTANYWIGHYIGPKVFHTETRLIKREYLERTKRFYDKHGGITIFLARFIPIIRTFAPFVAGVGQMRYGYFITYNIVGGVVWTGALLMMATFSATCRLCRNISRSSSSP